MELIDTHCHLYLKEFAEDLADVMQRAGSEGVKKFYLPSIDSSQFADLIELEEKFPQQCVAMAGLHPCSVKESFQAELSFFREALGRKKYAAIGEIGLDFYWDRQFEAQQYIAFHEQIEWALEFQIPIVIHSRDSMEQSIQVVREHQHGNLKGIFHCFNEGLDFARQIVDLGFYLGIGGVITYKNAGLDKVIKEIDPRHIILETDAPYLTPVPFRGKRNEPGYLSYILQKLADIRETNTGEIAAVTTNNAEKLFGL